MTETEMLSDEQLKEIEARFHLTTDGDAVFVLSRAPVLCQTVRALRKELSEAYYESCEICDQEIVSGDGTKIHTFTVGGCCWNKSQETITALREQLAQRQSEIAELVGIIQTHGDTIIKQTGRIDALQSQLAQVEKERHNLQVHVEERDSLLNSQTTGKNPLPENFVCIAPAEAPLVIDLLCGKPTEIARVHLELCARCKEFASLADTVATAMRSRCVEKVKALFHNSEVNRSRWNEAIIVAVKALESLPLEQGEQEKH